MPYSTTDKLYFQTKCPFPPCSQWVCESLIFTYRHLWKIRYFRLSEAGKLKFSVSQVPLCHSFGQLNVSDVCWKELPWKILKKENSADRASLAHIPACDNSVMPKAKGWSSRMTEGPCSWWHQKTITPVNSCYLKILFWISPSIL